MNDDLISRSAAIEIIRSMTISLGGKDIFTPEAKESVIGVLDEIEAVDAELVIRCNICKHYETDTGYCYMHDHGMDWDDFCSRGEKVVWSKK